MSNVSIVIGVLNAIKGMLTQKPGEGSLMALEYKEHYQKFNNSIGKISAAQITQAFAHSEIKERFKGMDMEQLKKHLKSNDPQTNEITTALRESTNQIFSEEDKLLHSILTSEYLVNEPPFMDYIDSYEKSKASFYSYVPTGQVPAEILFEFLKDKYRILETAVSRLLHLTTQLNITSSSKVSDSELRDKYENALESVSQHYKEQYQYACKRLEGLNQELEQS
ncbi:hypothetical protein [Priestia megaterium]|uniref:hypothetical protein n=1 Tax=Priestia megaterium TaxID=1404 RepID=UPI00177A9A68|nr:hypothetical protein [Priestia megaterium]MBD8109675.1 hypothetical protein [Priestia megaterium]